MPKPKRATTHEGTIHVGTIYAYHADIPMIEIELEGFQEPKAQLTLPQAREIVAHLLYEIAAAEADGFSMRYFRDTIGLEPPQLAGLIAQFRTAREALDRPGRTSNPPNA